MYDVPYPIRHIGIIEIGNVIPPPNGGSQKVKVKIRINPNGIFGVSSACLVENGGRIIVNNIDQGVQ